MMYNWYDSTDSTIDTATITYRTANTSTSSISYSDFVERQPTEEELAEQNLIAFVEVNEQHKLVDKGKPKLYRCVKEDDNLYRILNGRGTMLVSQKKGLKKLLEEGYKIEKILAIVPEDKPGDTPFDDLIEQVKNDGYRKQFYRYVLSK